MRSSSSSSSGTVCRTSAGSSGLISSRWPRTIVSGVFSSCRTSLSSWCWVVIDFSSRSSMSLTVEVSALTSSLPETGIRPDRSLAVIREAAAVTWRIGRSSRPATNQPTRPIATSETAAISA